MSAAPKSRNTDRTPEALRRNILAAVEAESQRIAEAGREAHQRIQSAESEHDVELDSWRSKALQANRDRAPEPPRPEPADTAADRALIARLQDERSALVDQRSDAMRSSAGQVEAGWSGARATLADEAREALQALQPVLEQVEDWRKLVSEVRKAQDFAPGRRAINGPSSRMRSKIGLPDLLALAEGRDVLAPAELPQQRQSYGPGSSEEDVFNKPRQLGYKPVPNIRDVL